VYGAPAMLGRTFTPQEDSPRGGKEVVLSYGLWQRRFAGDPSIVGKFLSLGNEPYTMVGVIGKDFVTDPQADLWLPFQFDPVSTDGNLFFEATGLLRPGVTVAHANVQLRAVSHLPDDLQPDAASGAKRDQFHRATSGLPMASECLGLDVEGVERKKPCDQRGGPNTILRARRV
jgi:hypothetical protein